MRPLLVLLMAALLASCLGCAMCADPHDCKYAAYGGIRERVDMVQGRLGSVYNPATEINHANSAQGSTLPLNSMLGEPTPAEDRDEEDMFDDSEESESDNERPSPLDDLPDLPDGEDDRTIDDLLNELPKDEARLPADSNSLQVTDEVAPSEYDFDAMFKG